MNAAARDASEAYARSSGAPLHPAPAKAEYRLDDLPVGGRVKRIFDLILVLVAGPLLIPLFIALGLAIRLTSPGPVFFAHERVGFHGRTFRCFKFRTMVQNADEVLARHLEQNAAARREWAATQKLQNDPRVTQLGRLLRALSLDELPQLFNVIKGEMSLVGPRPVVRAELERYRGAIIYYVSARPGLTGLWQVSGRNDVSYNHRVRLDRTYVAGWTLMADIWILARTIPAVLAARGSY